MNVKGDSKPDLIITMENSRYGVVDYSTVSSVHNCTCVGPCRCSVISSVEIEKIYLLDPESVVNLSYQDVKTKRAKRYTATTIERYAIDRLVRIHKLYDPSYWTADISNGYYGQEVIGFTFDGEREFLKDVASIFKLPTEFDIVKFVLQKEYKHLLPVIDDAVGIELVELDTASLFRQNEYFSRIKNEDSNYEFAKNVPVGIAYNRTRILDGYHRLASLGSGMHTFINIIPK